MVVIREKLVISLNTARFHTKNIYVKLGVHSQQELIDVVEGFKLRQVSRRKKPRCVSRAFAAGFSPQRVLRRAAAGDLGG